MINWKKITLFQFQQVDAINSNADMPDIDKALFTTCIVFNLTEYQLDNTPALKASRMVTRVNKLFSNPFDPKPYDKIGKYFLNYDPGTMRFGQFMELNYYLSVNPTANAHYVMASISNEREQKNDSGTHPVRAEYFLQQPVIKIMGPLGRIIETFRAFTNSYKWLFGLSEQTHGEQTEAVQEHPFSKKYGWMYSAEKVADYERLTLDQVYALPVRHVFNSLAYIKAKGQFEAEQLKNK